MTLVIASRVRNRHLFVIDGTGVVLLLPIILITEKTDLSRLSSYLLLILRQPKEKVSFSVLW